jgi:sterol desaturase/sphingolipid hydroxylase (fatty acid hydroxylase superfamily)
VTRLLVPVTGAAAAVAASRWHWGLLGAVPWPTWFEWAIALVALDLAVYLQHRLFHAVPWCWRWHRVHHADVAFDVSTGVRFHPVEIAISALFKSAAVVAVGASVTQTLTFEIVLSTGALFSHANATVAGDRWLRRWLVTPDMHRVHHSPVRDEQDSNFGFCLPWWDHLFGTYREAPRTPHAVMRLGIDGGPR